MIRDKNYIYGERNHPNTALIQYGLEGDEVGTLVLGYKSYVIGPPGAGAPVLYTLRSDAWGQFIKQIEISGYGNKVIGCENGEIVFIDREDLEEDDT